MDKPETTKDAEELAQWVIDNASGMMKDEIAAEVQPFITAAEQRGFARGKADVVPSGDAKALAQRMEDECQWSSVEEFGFDQEIAANLIQSSFDAREAAARAEGERAGFERAVPDGYAVVPKILNKKIIKALEIATWEPIETPYAPFQSILDALIEAAPPPARKPETRS